MLSRPPGPGVAAAAAAAPPAPARPCPQPARVLRAPGTAPSRGAPGEGKGGGGLLLAGPSPAAVRGGQGWAARRGSPARRERARWIWGGLLFLGGGGGCPFFSFPPSLAQRPCSRRSSRGRYKTAGKTIKRTRSGFGTAPLFSKDAAPSLRGGKRSGPGAGPSRGRAPAEGSAPAGSGQPGSGRQLGLSGSEGGRVPRVLCSLGRGTANAPLATDGFCWGVFDLGFSAYFSPERPEISFLLTLNTEQRSWPSNWKN